MDFDLHLQNERKLLSERNKKLVDVQVKYDRTVRGIQNTYDSKLMKIYSVGALEMLDDLKSSLDVLNERSGYIQNLTSYLGISNEMKEKAERLAELTASMPKKEREELIKITNANDVYRTLQIIEATEKIDTSTYDIYSFIACGDDNCILISPFGKQQLLQKI